MRKNIIMSIVTMCIVAVLGCTVSANEGLNKSFGEIVLDEEPAPAPVETDPEPIEVVEPVEETPIEETIEVEPVETVEDTPDEELPTEEVSTEPVESPAEEATPAETEEPAEETPVEVTPEEELPTEEVSTPVEEMPVETEPVEEETPAEEVSDEVEPSTEKPADEKPIDKVIEKVEEVINDVIIGKEKQDTPAVELPEEVVSTEPVETAPEASADEQVVEEQYEEKEEVSTSSDNGNEDTPASDEYVAASDNTVSVTTNPELVVVPETEVEESTPERTTKSATKSATKSTTKVLSAKRPTKTTTVAAATVKPVETVVSEENDDAGKSILPVALFIVLALIVGRIFLFLFPDDKEYSVVKRYTEDGEEKMEILKKFHKIEKACEYVRDYGWNTEDAYNALNILNNTRDDEYEDENGNMVDEKLVYYVSKDKTVQGIHFASDDEMDAIGRILGYVQEEALA